MEQVTVGDLLYSPSKEAAEFYNTSRPGNASVCFGRYFDYGLAPTNIYCVGLLHQQLGQRGLIR